MGVAAIQPFAADPDTGEFERRSAPRFTSLIRSAKLVCGKGEFVCVVRDVSASGVRLRCFHQVPQDPSISLELQNGESFEVVPIRCDGLEASFRFREADIRVERLIREEWLYPRRPLRLAIQVPLAVRTIAGPIPAVSLNLSQQGCRVETAFPLAIAQAVIIESPQIPGIRAKVRWRQGGECGLAFDDTFSLSEFARLAARLQSPSLVAS